MFGRSLARLLSRRSPVRKPLRSRHRILRGEWLEPRTMLSGGSASSSATGLSTTPVNTAPSVFQAISINSNAAVTGKSPTLSVLGSDDHGEGNLLYTWSVTTSTVGASAVLSVNGTNAAKNDTVTFTKAGTYNITVTIVDAGGLSGKRASSVVVSPALTSVKLTAPNGQVVSPSTPLTVSGVSQTLAAQGFDQFGNALAATPAWTWSITTSPSGATRPVISATGGNASVTFSKAGEYTLAVSGRCG